MPGTPPHPRTRTLLHRKVHMRLAALGMSASHVSAELFSDTDPKNRSAFFNRLLKGRYRCDETRRRRLEALLSLPTGALADDVQLGVVGCIPIPDDVAPESGHRAPDADDVQPGAAFGDAGDVLRLAGRSLGAVVEVLKPVTPGDVDPAVVL